eukprot:12740002-Alexandrium_andersonii.AAC.1
MFRDYATLFGDSSPRRPSRPASSCRPSTSWCAPARSRAWTSPCSARAARGWSASSATSPFL